jgi:phosphorylcholine metabolism protein LicD
MNYFILIILLLFGICIWILKSSGGQKNLLFNDIKLTQQKLKEYFKDLDGICSKHNIQYWAEGGTLLGAVRETGIIPHDDDIDVSLLESDFEKLKQIIDSGIYPQYEIVQIELPLPIYKLLQKGIPHVSIDLFVVENQKGIVNFKEEKHRELWPKFYHKLENVFPLKRVPFEDFYTWIPRNPFPYLESGYGDWKTPVDYGRHTIH